MRFYILVLSAILAACSSQTARNDHGVHTADNAADHNTTGNMAHGNSSAPPSDSSYTVRSSSGVESAPYDLQFIDSMTVHHQDAIQMAEFAESRALHPEIKELAANIIHEQERETAKMSEWRDNWFEGKGRAINMDLPGMHHSVTGMDMKKLESLKGNEFDLEFLRQMIRHHEGAVKMAQDAGGRGARVEVKDLAGDIVSAQNDEIAQMRRWLAEWSKQ